MTTTPTAPPAEPSKLLLIDDDAKLSELLERYFANQPWDLHAELCPVEALAYFDANGADLVILDVMMPKMDGFDVCRELRKRSEVPIIMLTARGDETDRIVGLEMGADDYLPKPFSPRELAARIKAILRRTSAPRKERSSIEVGEIRFDVGARRVFLRDEEVRLTSTELEIFALMMDHRGQALSRDRIMNALCGMDVNPFDRSIDVHISNLRRKLETDPKTPRYILTVWGTGYRFVESL